MPKSTCLTKLDDAQRAAADSPKEALHARRYVESPATVVGDLPSYALCVKPDALVSDVIKKLQKHPELPGALIIEKKRFIGVVSRQKCLERLSRPYGNALFLKRSVLNLYEDMGAVPLVIPHDTPIDKAVNLALSRPSHELYEPVVIVYQDESLRLVDLHVLLLAQSQLLETANRRVRQQVEIERALTSTLEFAEVLDLILKHIGDVVPYDRAGILLQNDTVLRFVASRGFPTGFDVVSVEIDIRESDVYDQVRRTRQPLVVPDVSRQPDWQNFDRLPNAKAWIGIPLIHSDEVIGMLSLTRTVSEPYSPDEIELVKTLTGQATVAMQNALLYDRIRRFNQTLETVVQERTQALQDAYNKLERLDKAKSDFIDVASHELRTPLTVISSYTQMLMQDSLAADSKRHKKMLSGIYTGIQRLHEIVNSMLDVARIDQRNLELHMSPTQMVWVLRSLVKEFDQALAERGLTLEVAVPETLPVIHLDVSAIRKVFYQLLINAIKYTPDGGRIAVSGQFLPAAKNPLNEDAIEVVVADTGIGIDPQFQELIFTKFYQTGSVSLHSTGKVNFKGGGPGLGLAIVQGIIEAHRGRVWCESPGHDETTLPGSKFFVLLPVRN
ncbi:MAG: GAF domain-containing protein [Anaerolineae bacterium]|nr:GAF domain-containing protein [Anaerolineae bacterium]